MPGSGEPNLAMTPSPGPTREAHRPLSSQRVSVSWDEPTTPNGSRRFQFEVSECVETKTVTTTTTTKRTFPPVFVRESRRLESLDAKEYPLALKPTPPELAKFSYDVAGFQDIEDAVLPKPAKHQVAERASVEHMMPQADTPHVPEDGLLSRSPSESYPRRTRRSSTRPRSPCPTSTHKPPRPSRSVNQHTQGMSDRLRRSAAQIQRREGDRPARPTGFLATPDTSEVNIHRPERSGRPRYLNLERASTTPEAGPSQAHSYEAASPIGSDSHTVFSSTVATPPITDADAEPYTDADESLQQSIRALQTRPTIEVAAAQDASLPSPRLSPTLAAAQLQNEVEEEESLTFPARSVDAHRGRWAEDSQASEDVDSQVTMPRQPDNTLFNRSRRASSPTAPPTFDPQSMLEAFDAMPGDMKTLMMYQFLRRCPRKTLRVIADVVNPSMQCDFFKQLPLELSYHILSYLDHRDLCRAAQSSKHWRNIVDSNETGWKELLDRDGFNLGPDELERAIKQGWGWQDPVGHTGYEIDLGAQKHHISVTGDPTRSGGKAELHVKVRSSKRKRGLNSYSAGERSKRRASAHDTQKDAHQEVKQHKSEGPLSAANAAAAAVPDPQIGLPSLRKLHLFKSLYRRHHMIRHGWTSGKVQPAHVAFTAHSRNVITCLQFDEDKLITGSDDTMIHVYDTKTGQLRKKLEGHEGGVWALQYEGNMLVSGSTDRSVRVWDIEKGLCTQVFYGHTSTVRCLQILMPTEIGKDHHNQPIKMPAKPLIITGSRDSQLRVWDLPEPGSRRYIQTGPPANDADCPYYVRTLTGHTHSVRAISAYGDTLVSGSYDSTVRVWRIKTGEARHILQGHQQKVYSVVLDHQRNRCISGSMDSNVRIWDLATGGCLYTLEGHNLLVGLLDLRDERLVSAAADSTLRIWDPENGKCRNVLTAHTGAITCFQHDGWKVISGSEKTVKMWDIATGDCIQDLLTDLGGVWQVKFDERRCVAAVQRDGLTYVEILDFGAIRDGKPQEELGRRIVLNEEEERRILEDDI